MRVTSEQRVDSVFAACKLACEMSHLPAFVKARRGVASDGSVRGSAAELETAIAV